MEQLYVIGLSVGSGMVLGSIFTAYTILRDIVDNNKELEELKRLCEKYKPYYLLNKKNNKKKNKTINPCICKNNADKP